ncbi:hypothetical protein [Clostridium fessum]|uniref:hypothetical protein n=1 Tax=Clostridium fessum TaxID=2126740 RepID=UPI00399BE76F
MEHLYYGRHLTLPEHPAERDVAPLMEKHTFAPGNTNLCDGEHPAFSLEDMRQRCPPTEKETSANRLWRSCTRMAAPSISDKETMNHRKDGGDRNDLGSLRREKEAQRSA